MEEVTLTELVGKLSESVDIEVESTMATFIAITAGYNVYGNMRSLEVKVQLL